MALKFGEGDFVIRTVGIEEKPANGVFWKRDLFDKGNHVIPAAIIVLVLVIYRAAGSCPAIALTVPRRECCIPYHIHIAAKFGMG